MRVGVDGEEQPASSACRSRRLGGSCRSGRELISTALPCSAQAANTAAASKSDGGRPLAVTAVAWALGADRPVGDHAAGAVAEDVEVRVLDRREHPPGHPGALVAESAVDGADHDVEPGEQLVLLVERAVGEDVDLDAGEDPEALRQRVVDRGHVVELSRQPVGGQPAGHLQPRRVVGEHHVLVPELDRRERHLLDRRAAVGPVGVGVAVAAQRRPQRRGGVVEVDALGRVQPAQVDRLLAGAATPSTQRAVTSPTPDSSVSVPAAARSATSPAGSAPSVLAADRNARTR